MANTGNKIFTKLVKVTNDINEYPLDINDELCSATGLAQAEKTNTLGDPNYIAPFQDLTSCPLTPTSYKIKTLTPTTTSEQVVCAGQTYSNTTTTIRLQLVELDGSTIKINNTGSDITINMKYKERHCYDPETISSRLVVIPNGQSFADISNTSTINDCGVSDCRYEEIEYTCYAEITPPGIVEVISGQFYEICL